MRIKIPFVTEPVTFPSAFLLWVADAVLCSLIIYKIPYTEIDWIAYMEQAAQIIHGETDYLKIRGGTGPLVYPGGHVSIFCWLYELTNHGSDILRAQILFAGLYLTTLALVLWLYVKHKVPVYYAIMLIFSKRLHSIYLLRLFNDCFCTFFVVIACLCLDYRLLVLSSILFSTAVSIKMNALLVLPGAALAYYLILGKSILRPLFLLGPPFIAVQLTVAMPFTDHWRSYIEQAFEFSRQFLYEWTVNWRFIDEEVFGSKSFALTLLFLHVFTLSVFIIRQLYKYQQNHSIDSFYLISMANIIGILFARSLHYQFYSWFYWTIPYILYKSRLPWILTVFIWIAQEYAWNVFPSTVLSSGIVVGVMGLMVVSTV